MHRIISSKCSFFAPFATRQPRRLLRSSQNIEETCYYQPSFTSSSGPSNTLEFPPRGGPQAQLPARRIRSSHGFQLPGRPRRFLESPSFQPQKNSGYSPHWLYGRVQRMFFECLSNVSRIFTGWHAGPTLKDPAGQTDPSGSGQLAVEDPTACQPVSALSFPCVGNGLGCVEGFRLPTSLVGPGQFGTKIE